MVSVLSPVSKVPVSPTVTALIPFCPCRFPLFHERMDAIKTFHSLKSLDLFGCRLGDNHEIFPHLTSSSLSR